MEGIVLLERYLPSANRRPYEQAWLPYRSGLADEGPGMGPGGCIRVGLDVVLIGRSLYVSNIDCCFYTKSWLFWSEDLHVFGWELGGNSV